jgi:hypothetical protein
MTSRYHDRTVQWGHWGITFMDPQPDRTKNFGVIAGHISFPIGTRGPCDMDSRMIYRQMCTAWIDRREIPKGFISA